MNIESLIDRIIEENNQSDFKQFIDQVLKMKLYFFVINDGSFSSVDEIVFTGKERPVSIPIVKGKDKTSAILYTSKELALKNIENGFRVSYTLKGIDALKFLHSAMGVNQIILQGNNGHICLDDQMINKTIKSTV